MKVKPLIKNYLTELSANILGNDVELCEKCLKHYEDFLKDPYTLICRVKSTSKRSNEQQFVFILSREEVNRGIWRAQIKTLYPIIEEYRENFVSRYDSAIRAELPIRSTYGEVINEPWDVEIGTLVYMAARRKLMLDSTEYERLSRYREARNKLSHLNILSIEEIMAL